MQKRTVVDLVDVDEATGTISVRMRKETLDDGGKVTGFEYHRTAISPLHNVDLTMDAVDDHLAQMGFPGVSAEHRAVIDATAGEKAQLRAVRAQEFREDLMVRFGGGAKSS